MQDQNNSSRRPPNERRKPSPESGGKHGRCPLSVDSIAHVPACTTYPSGPCTLCTLHASWQSHCGEA
eukprot:2871128-Rhodomonas_salina.5